MGKGFRVGFDLGGTKMLSVLYDDDFKSLGRERRRTRGHEGVEFGLKRICETIHRTLKKNDADIDDLIGIGVGCPGTLDLDSGVILDAPNLGWKNAKIRKVLTEEFDCPVVILNDVDAGVYGEYRFGAAKEARCAVGVFPGTGVGGGCVYEGRILRGKRSSCMEVGYMPLAGSGPRAGAGPPGSLEALASRLAISGEAAKAVYRGQAPALRESAGTDLGEIRSGVLAKAIAEGDDAIRDIVEEAADYVGQAVGTLVNILGPDIVILGGGLVEAMPEIYLPAVKSGSKKTVLPELASEFKIEVAQLGDDSTSMGAAGWVQEESAKADAAK
jgi:glucokinase